MVWAVDQTDPFNFSEGCGHARLLSAVMHDSEYEWGQWGQIRHISTLGSSK